MKRFTFGNLLMILALGAAALGTIVPPDVQARGGSKDPLVQWEAQRRHNEEHKVKRREALDYQGDELRDAKKSSEDSKQNAALQEFGQPNQQPDRWTTP